MKNRLSFQIMQDALTFYKKKRGNDEINYSDLSKTTGSTISSLWFYFKGQRRWPADAFMRVLYELGALHYNDNTILIQFDSRDKGELFIHESKKSDISL